MVMALNHSTVLPLVTIVINTTNATSTTQPESGGSLMMGLIIEFVALLIFLGNLAILIVLKLYKPLNIPDVLVLSLSLSDFLNVSFPVQILNLTVNILKRPYTEELCIIYVWATYTFRMASVMTVSVICADRWLAILKPLYYRSNVIGEVLKVKIIIASLWILAALIALPPHIGLGSTGFKNGTCFYQLIDLGLGYGILIEILGLAQLGLVLYIYISIKISTTSFLRRQKKMRGASDTNIFTERSHKVSFTTFSKSSVDKKLSTSSQSTPTFPHKNSLPPLSPTLSRLVVSGQPKRNLTDGERQVSKIEKMMALVVVLYYITWLPFLITNLFSLVTGKSNSLAVTIVGFFSLINGLLNPIVYGTLNVRYRKGYSYIFRKIISICGGKKPELTLEDFNDNRRKTKRNLQNVQKMRSISTSEHSSVRSRGHTWSSSSATSSISGDGDYDTLYLKSSIGSNNNHQFDELKNNISRITIVEEPEVDDAFEDSGNAETEANTSDVTHTTDVSNHDVDSKRNDDQLGENKENNSTKPTIPKSPPVIMSYRLSSSLDSYVKRYQTQRSSSIDSSIHEGDVDNDAINIEGMENENTTDDVRSGGADKTAEAAKEEHEANYDSHRKHGIVLEVPQFNDSPSIKNVCPNEHSEIGSVNDSQQKVTEPSSSLKESELVKPSETLRIRKTSSELTLHTATEKSTNSVDITRTGIKRSATMPVPDHRKSNINRNEDLESMLDRCIALKNQYYSPKSRACRRVLSYDSRESTVARVKEESDNIKPTHFSLDNLAFEPEEHVPL